MGVVAPGEKKVYVISQRRVNKCEAVTSDKTGQNWFCPIIQIIVLFVVVVVVVVVCCFSAC